LLLALALSISLFSFAQNDRPIQPSIIVVPYTTEGQDIRKILDTDPDIATAITKIKEGFDNKNFNTVDFVAKLKQAMDQKAFSGQNLSDIKSQLINFSGADIYVEVKILKYSNNGLNKVTLLLQAYDVSSARSLANADCISNTIRTNDFPALVSAALSHEQGDSSVPCRDIFLNTLQGSIERMMKEGRPITMQIGFSQDSKFNADYMVKDKLLSEIINEWLDKNAQSVNPGGETTNTINYNEIRIPYKDEVTKKNNRVSGFISKFIAYLKTFGISANRDIKGGIIYITIN